MIMKYLLVLVLIIVASESSCQSAKVSDEIVTKRIQLKNYAMCKCIQHSSPEGNALVASDGSSAGYFEIGSYSIETYAAVDSLSNVAAMEKTVSKYNRPLSLMKCLDFYNSQKLDAFIRQFDSEVVNKR